MGAVKPNGANETRVQDSPNHSSLVGKINEADIAAV